MTRSVPARCGGFTLVELLVALAAMAMLSLLAWRGVDAMGRALETTRRIDADVQALQAGLMQWGADLDAVVPPSAVTPLDYDGQVLRITRQVALDDGQAVPDAGQGGGGLRVVAWGSRLVDGRRQWLRWQSPLLRTRAAWEQAWQQAAWWGQNPDAALRQAEVAIVPIEQWQLFYYRNNSWTSPLSSASEGGQTAPEQQPLPDGVRLVLVLSDGQPISGELRRDWARPSLGPGGS